MSALQDCYAEPTTPFGAGGAFYDGSGHRGTDYARAAGEPIIAYDDMIVEYVGKTAGLGYVIGLRRLTLGGFAGFAHAVDLMPLGARVKKGARLADVAGWGDMHGTLWTGPHIHTTESAASAQSAALGIRPLTDPAPTIAAAIGGSSTAAGPGPATPIPKENLMRDRFIYRTDDTGKPVDWSIVGGDVGKSGVIATADQATANNWATIYGPAELVRSRDEYVRRQNAARQLYNLSH